MPGHVFVSYSRKDSVYVRRLIPHLVAAGIPIWIDDAIDYGDNWEDVICRQIDTCYAVVAVMTPAAERSPWVRNEIARALSRTKPILPLLLAGDAFFSLGHIEYEDVRSAILPSPAFVTTLHRLVHGDGSGRPLVPPTAIPPVAHVLANRGNRARFVSTAPPPGTGQHSGGSLLRRFELRLGQIIGPVSAEAFKGAVHPVEILSAIQREAERHKALLLAGGTHVPGRYVIDLSPHDHGRLAPYERVLISELMHAQAEFFDEQSWTVTTPVSVEFNVDEGLEPGLFRVTPEPSHAPR